MQLLEEKLRRELTDGFESSIDLIKKQAELRNEKLLLIQRREFEAKVMWFTHILNDICNNTFSNQ